jgi:hypothetical protein
VIEVFLAGEGRNELGGWCSEPGYDTSTMVEHVERCGLAAIPADATSLRAWLKHVEGCLQPIPTSE